MSKHDSKKRERAVRESLAAVAAAGCAELADEFQAVRTAATELRQALADVVVAYADFAQQRPAQYGAMFTDTVDLPFASPESPVPLRHAFAELCQTPWVLSQARTTSETPGPSGVGGG